MPDEPHPPAEPNPPYEPTRMAGSDHPSGDTWRLAQTPTRTGGSFPPSSPGGAPPPVEVIGDFEVVGKLGQGGMGTVYRARQLSLNRLVALKILPAKLEADAEYVARFQREARVAASLNHAHLVRVYTSGTATGCHYIAMELIEGETLADWVKRGPMPPLQAVRIILAVTQALECGWRTAQLIHRDIKPGNIFLSNEGAVKLGDLGLAKTIGSDTTGLTQTGAMMGTPHYISPEQARGDKDLDFRADIYSLGCTLYQMLTGQTPYDGRDPFSVMNMHVNAPPPAILKVLPHCPIPLARLVSKMLKKQRRERHASYEELIAQLETVQALLDPAMTAPATMTREDRGGGGDSRGLVDGRATHPTPAGVVGRVSSPAAGSTTSGMSASEPIGVSGKSKVPLYGGIAAAVLLLATAGYFLWPKEEKLTAAQRWSREHAGDKAAQTEPTASRGATGALAPAGTDAEAMPNITSWQDVMQKAKTELRTIGKAEVAEENGWIVATKRGSSGFQIYSKKITDTAVRGQLRGRTATVTIRDFEGNFSIHFKLDGNSYIERIDRIPGEPQRRAQIATFTMPAIPEYGFLITMIGEELRVWVERKLVATVHDFGNARGTVCLSLESDGAAMRDLAVADLSIHPNTAATPSTAPAGAVNLLSLVDVKRDAVAGIWSMTPEGLTLQHNGKMEFNYAPPAEYDFATEFTIQAGGSGDVTQILALPDRGTIWRMLLPACFGSKLDGLDAKDPNRTEGVARSMGRLKKDQRYRSVVEVRMDSLRALLDGVEVLKFTGDLKRLSGDGQFKLRDPRHLGLAGNNNTDILFHSAEVWPAGAGAGAALANGVPTSPTPKFSSSSEPWVDALADPAALKLVGSLKRTAAGLEFGEGNARVEFPRLTGPDYAVRVLVQPTDKQRKTWLYLRHTGRSYTVVFDGSNSVSIGQYVGGGKFENLKKFTASRTVQAGESYELEARIVGNKITVGVDGVTLGPVEDDSLPEGGPSIDVGPIIRGVQYLDLSAPAKSAGEPAAVKLWDAPEKIPHDSRVKWENEALRLTGFGAKYSQRPSVDAILRAVVKMAPKSQCKLCLRFQLTDGKENDYEFTVQSADGKIHLGVKELGRYFDLQSWPAPREYGAEEWVPVELRVVGDELTATIEGRSLGSVHNAVLAQPGGAMVFGHDGYFRNIEYVPLGGAK